MIISWFIPALLFIFTAVVSLLVVGITMVAIIGTIYVYHHPEEW